MQINGVHCEVCGGLLANHGTAMCMPTAATAVASNEPITVTLGGAFGANCELVPGPRNRAERRTEAKREGRLQR